jgi:peptide/nickel transport system substrate-binding protein
MNFSSLICRFPLRRILLVVPAILFTLCAGPANSAPEPGTVTILLAGEPVNLDPGECTHTSEGQILKKNILETLTDRNPGNSSITPRLATSWKQIDANTWHFYLRKGVKFHDGKDFNAEAAVFNIRRLYDNRVKSADRAKFFTDIKMEGKALDSYTLEVKTDKPAPLLPTLMEIMTICSPNTPLDKWTRNPIGTGPYKFVKWDAGTQIIFERFDGYWGQQPQVKKAIYIWRNESSVRAAMLEIGEADLTPDIAQGNANRPDMDYSYLNSNTSYLRIGGEWEPPLNDRRVRMALNYAVDRNALRGSILSKDVVPATQLVIPSTLGYNANLKVWPYDPQKAKQLLDEARKDGVPVDKEITLVDRNGQYPGGEELIEAVMTMYKAVGLNVKLRMFEKGAMRTYENKPYPTNVGPYIVHKTHDNNTGDAVFTVFFKYHCNGVQSAMCDKTVDDLIEKAQAATGENRRNLWQAAFKRIQEEIIPDVILYHMVAYARVGKRINYRPSTMTLNEIPLEQITFRQ